MDITFSIVNQTITRTDQAAVVAGSRGYLYAAFSFSDDWHGLIKTAQFKRDDIVMDMLLVNDRCTVPWELLAKQGIIQVTVFGGDLITVNQAAIPVQPTGMSLANTPALLPTPNYYAQVIKALGVPGPQGETGPQGPQGPQGDPGLDGSAVPIDDASTAADRVLSASYIKGQLSAIDVQLAEKVQNFKLKNEVVNGDFSNGVVGWEAGGGALSAENNKAKIVTLSTYGNIFDYISLISGKYYTQVSVQSSIIGNDLFVNWGTNVTFYKLSSNIDFTSQKKISGVFDATSTTRFGFNIYKAGSASYIAFFDDIILINLTSIFGAGNEPTKLEMDELMKVIPNGWWDGELSLTNKQFITWQLNLIRKNTNAIIALGGTIV